MADELQNLSDSDLPLPDFPHAIIPDANPKQLLRTDKENVKKLEQELNSMRYEVAEVPSTESLMKLYTIQAKGRAFYERSEEIYRQYLRYLSNVTLLREKAELHYKQISNKAASYTRQKNKEEFYKTKSSTEREDLIDSNIPQHLQEEYLSWKILESTAKTNFSILKSYRDQFRSINDNVLVQLSIFKNLITLGELKVDPEIIRVMHIIDSSYRPTNQDLKEKQQFDQPTPELNIDEGDVKI